MQEKAIARARASMQAKGHSAISQPHDLKAALAVRALARRLHKADFEAVRGDGTLSGHKSIVSAVHVADEEFYLHDRLAFLYLS